MQLMQEQNLKTLFNDRMNQASQKNKIIGEFSTEEFSNGIQKSSKTGLGESIVVQASDLIENQEVPKEVDQVIRLVETMEECQNVFTPKEFRKLLNHPLPRSTLTLVVNLYNKKSLPLESNIIIWIVSLLSDAERRENEGKEKIKKKKKKKEKDKSRQWMLKTTVWVSNIERKKRSRSLNMIAGDGGFSTVHSEASDLLQNVRGRKSRSKSSPESKSKFGYSSPQRGKNFASRMQRFYENLSPSQTHFCSRYQRSQSQSQSGSQSPCLMTNVINIPSNPYASYLPTLNGFDVSSKGMAQKQSSSFSEASHQTPYMHGLSPKIQQSAQDPYLIITTPNKVSPPSMSPFPTHSDEAVAKYPEQIDLFLNKHLAAISLQEPLNVPLPVLLPSPLPPSSVPHPHSLNYTSMTASNSTPLPSKNPVFEWDPLSVYNPGYKTPNIRQQQHPTEKIILGKILEIPTGGDAKHSSVKIPKITAASLLEEKGLSYSNLERQPLKSAASLIVGRQLDERSNRDLVSDFHGISIKDPTGRDVKRSSVSIPKLSAASLLEEESLSHSNLEKQPPKSAAFLTVSSQLGEKSNRDLIPRINGITVSSIKDREASLKKCTVALEKIVVSTLSKKGRLYLERCGPKPKIKQFEANNGINEPHAKINDFTSYEITKFWANEETICSEKSVTSFASSKSSVQEYARREKQFVSKFGGKFSSLNSLEAPQTDKQSKNSHFQTIENSKTGSAQLSKAKRFTKTVQRKVHNPSMNRATSKMKGNFSPLKKYSNTWKDCQVVYSKEPFSAKIRTFSASSALKERESLLRNLENRSEKSGINICSVAYFKGEQSVKRKSDEKLSRKLISDFYESTSCKIKVPAGVTQKKLSVDLERIPISMLSNKDRFYLERRKSEKKNMQLESRAAVRKERAIVTDPSSDNKTLEFAAEASFPVLKSETEEYGRKKPNHCRTLIKDSNDDPKPIKRKRKRLRECCESKITSKSDSTANNTPTNVLQSKRHTSELSMDSDEVSETMKYSDPLRCLMSDISEDSDEVSFSDCEIYKEQSLQISESLKDFYEEGSILKQKHSNPFKKNVETAIKVQKGARKSVAEKTCENSFRPKIKSFRIPKLSSQSKKQIGVSQLSEDFEVRSILNDRMSAVGRPKKIAQRPALKGLRNRAASVASLNAESDVQPVSVDPLKTQK